MHTRTDNGPLEGQRGNSLRYCLLAAWLIALASPDICAQDVIEVYNEKGVVVSRLNTGLDSLLLRIDSLPRSRYIVSVSNVMHGDSSLAQMSLRCMFNDAFCQSSGPLERDSIYEAEGFYDGHWISIDRRGEHARIHWEKHAQGGFMHGLCIIYSDTQIPVYMANFRSGRLDGMAANYDYQSGYYSCTLYRAGSRVRTLSWAVDGTMFYDDLWKPTRPTE